MKKIVFSLILGLLLNACSIKTAHIIDPAMRQAYWQQHVQQVEKIEQYRIRGSFAYLSDKQKTFANFFWQQYSPQHSILRITSTFGTRILDIESQLNYAKVTDQNGKVYIGKDTQTLILQLSNMDIPLPLLQQWIKGLSGGAEVTTLNSDALLESAQYTQGESVWLLNINEYDQQVTPVLPKRLKLSHNDEIIKLKIDKWLF